MVVSRRGPTVTAERPRPGDATALYQHGIALRGLGRPVEALISHDRSLAIRPANAAALNSRGHALVALVDLHPAPAG